MICRMETYRGVVYPWQCDHMGHMNVMCCHGGEVIGSRLGRVRSRFAQPAPAGRQVLYWPYCPVL